MTTLTAPRPSKVDFLPNSPAEPVTATKTSARARPRFPWKKIVSGVTLLVILAVGVTAYIRHAARFESTDDSFLDGNIHPVSARINGTVRRVLVDDNAYVEAGQPLVEIDPTDLGLALQSSQADVAQADANRLQAAAQVARAEAEVGASDARIAQNAAQVTRTEADFRRAETLVRADNGAISRQAFELARADFDAAQAAHSAAVSARASAGAALAAARAQESVAAAQLQKAQAAVALARLQIDYTVVRAPESGRVAKKNVEVGQQLQPGQPILSVVSDRVWVVANFKESQLRQLRVGETVDVKVDAIEGRTFRGQVDSFSPGTGAKFALLAPDNSTGNFTKIVQRVPVKIVFDPGSIGDAAPRLAPGLSALVTVHLRD